VVIVITRLVSIDRSRMMKLDVNFRKRARVFALPARTLA
jgi:hypothetical protein